MNLWSESRTELNNLPGIHPNSNGTIDFDFTLDEKQEIESFFKLLDDYRFHPEVALIMPKVGTAFALCKYAIGLVVGLPDGDDEEEYRKKAKKISVGLSKAMAALYKALSIYPVPVFTHHLIYFNDMAGRKLEGIRLRKIKQEQDAVWSPTQLDELFISWLDDSFPNVRSSRTM